MAAYLPPSIQRLIRRRRPAVFRQALLADPFDRQRTFRSILGVTSADSLCSESVASLIACPRMKRYIVAALVLLVVHTKAGAQILNADFELWDSVSTEKQAPHDWRAAQRGVSTGGLYGTFRDSAAYHGRYALMVSRWYAYTWDMAKQVVPTSERLGLLHGYYKYTDNDLMSGKDTAFVAVILTRWDPLSNRRDTIGMGVEDLTSSAEYQPFTVKVEYTSELTPDTLDISISPTVGHGQCQSGGWCSYLSVDDLRMDAASVSPATHRVDIAVYPNPATSSVRIAGLDTRSYLVSVTDVTGNTFVIRPASSGDYDLSGLAPGVYLLTVTDHNTVIYQSAVTKKNH
jgi:hypothetical protein